MKYFLIFIYIIVSTESFAQKSNILKIFGYDFIVSDLDLELTQYDPEISKKISNEFILGLRKNSKGTEIGRIEEFVILKIFLKSLNLKGTLNEYIAYDILNELNYEIKLLNINKRPVTLVKTNVEFNYTSYSFEDSSVFYIPFWKERALNDDYIEFELINESPKAKSININKSINLGQTHVDSVVYMLGNKKYIFYYDRNYLEFANELDGMIHGKNRANMPIDSILFYSIYKNFSKYDSDKIIEETLSFCQRGIKYKSDSDNMSEYLSPIQTLVRAEGDCEDKAILFSTMIAILTNKITYIVEFGEKDGIFEHALSAFSNDSTLQNGIPENVIYCEPSGYDIPVGTIQEKYLKSSSKKFTKIFSVDEIKKRFLNAKK